LSAMSQLLLNRFHCGRPDKGFWIFIHSHPIGILIKPRKKVVGMAL